MSDSWLITGGTGLLGSYLVWRLLAAGERPRVLVRDRDGVAAADRLRARLREIAAVSGHAVDAAAAEVVSGDVTEPHFGLDPDAWGRLARETSRVIHTAALLSFDDADAAAVTATNLGGTRQVIEFCREAGAVLHQVSTAFVCGRADGLVAEARAAAPPSFRNAYERSKWEGERLVFEAAAAGHIRALVYRPSIILGDRAFGYTSVFQTLYQWFHALDLLRKQALRRDGNSTTPDLDLRFPVDPRGTMSVVPVDYVADALLHIADHAEPDGRIFHLVCRDVPRNAAHLEFVLGALGARGVTLLEPDALPNAEMTPRERRIVAAVNQYRDYFNCRVDFADEAAASALVGSTVASPAVDAAWVERIIAYARDADWGRHRGGRGAAAASDRHLEVARGFFTHYLAALTGDKLLPDLERLDTVFTVEINEPAGGFYSVRIEGARITAVTTGRAADAQFTFVVPVEVLRRIVAGREDPREAFFAGRTGIEGDLETALAVIPVLKRFFEEYPYDGPA